MHLNPLEACAAHVCPSSFLHGLQKLVLAKAPTGGSLHNVIFTDIPLSRATSSSIAYVFLSMHSNHTVHRVFPCGEAGFNSSFDF